MNKAIIYGFLALLVLIGAYYFLSPSRPNGSFLAESANPEESTHPSWWLMFGGVLEMKDQSWKTLHGKLDTEAELRKKYLRANPLDTENGYYPQNVFRLLSRTDAKHNTQEIRFVIDFDRPSRSPNRNGSSGFFLIENYQNIDNFYQIGLEMSGQAVLKKKLKGTYSTLAQAKIWGEGEYDTESKLNLIPKNTPISLRIEKEMLEQGLLFKLWIKENEEWRLVLEALDSSPETLTEGKIGIRSDFMDITIEDYLLDSDSLVRQGANWQ